MAVLQLVQGDLGDQRRWELKAEQVVLGRHPDCDIVLDQASVSRQHARIAREGSNFFVEDLHSRNGTVVNGQPISGRLLLRSADKIKICDLVFAFYSDSNATPTLPLPPESSILIAVDDTPSSQRSSIVSKLEVSSSLSGERLTANPEAKLRALLEISNHLGNALSVDEVLPKILDGLFRIFVQADRGLIVLRASPEDPPIPKAFKHRRPTLEDSIRMSRTILESVMGSKTAVLLADAASDERFDASQSIAELRIRSVMCAPLATAEGDAIGAIQLDTIDQPQRFTQDDLEVLLSVARQAAVAVDNARLHENLLRQAAVQRDLELAQRVQRGLLPASRPKLAGYEFFDIYEPANQVGGDYYDYVELPGGRMAVVVADVSGKGVAAALLMARLSAEVRFCLALAESPAEAVDRINAIFCNSGYEDRFVTFVLAVVDTARHELTVVNAGHMAPRLRAAAGDVRPVGEAESGPPLGVSPDQTYAAYRQTLAPGELVILFTDGVSEAMNAAGGQYGFERLRGALHRGGTGAAGCGRAILDDVRRFVGGRPQNDDICLVCFGRR